MLLLIDIHGAGVLHEQDIIEELGAVFIKNRTASTTRRSTMEVQRFRVEKPEYLYLGKR